MTESLTESMSKEGVCRTAPATLDLLMNDKGVCRKVMATPGLLTMS